MSIIVHTKVSKHVIFNVIYMELHVTWILINGESGTDGMKYMDNCHKSYILIIL